MSDPNERDLEVIIEINSSPRPDSIKILAAYREEIEARLAPAPAQSREEEALIDERETLEHWDEHDVGTLTNALESAIDAYDALRARQSQQVAAAPQPSPQGEDVIQREINGCSMDVINYVNALRARLASAQSSAQGEEAREMREARDEEWKAWIKAKGFDLEPLAGCP